jgi:hypothetical protein
MLAHYKMTRQSWTVQRGPVSWLQACFEASLVTGRLYLNLLGIGAKRDGSGLRVTTYPEADDLCVTDLGGVMLDPATLAPDEQALFLHFIVMSNKAAAHLTTPGNYDPDKTHPAILKIHHYLKVNLYDVTKRGGLEAISIVALLIAERDKLNRLSKRLAARRVYRTGTSKGDCCRARCGKVSRDVGGYT